MKKEIETINKGQEKVKNTISELNNTVEGIKSRFDDAEDQISELDDKVGKNTQKEQEKEKRIRKNEDGLREFQDNMKCNNIRIIGIPEGEEEEQEKSLKTLYTWKNQLQHNLTTPAQQKTKGGGQTDPQTKSW